MDAERRDSKETKEVPSSKATSYGTKAKSAVLWNTGFNLFRDLLQFLQMLVLARLLDEAAYGQFAFVTSVIGFLSVFSAAPFLSYTLQVKSDDEVHYQDHFTASAVIQFTMFLVANLTGLIVAEIPSYADAAPLIHVLSFTFLLEWTCELRRKMIEREFDFRSLRLLHGIGLLLGTVVAIAMATTGCGAYSLVVPGMLVTLPFMWDLFVRQGWRPTWTFSWTHYRPAFQFGTTRIGSGISTHGKNLMESSTLAAVLGFGSLGVLNRAIGLANLACAKIASQLMYAIFPILTRLENENGDAARAGDMVLRLVLWTATPIAIVLGWLAGPVVHTIYGPTWSEVIPLMKWTLGLALVTASTQVVYMLVLARSRPRLCLSCDMVVLIGTAASLIFSLTYGVSSYLLSLTFIQFSVGLILAWSLLEEDALTRRGIKMAVMPALAGSLAGVGVASLFLWFLNTEAVTFITAAIWALCFTISYVTMLRLAFASTLAELISYLPARAAISRVLRLTI